jgi:hypothetical protein
MWRYLASTKSCKVECLPTEYKTGEHSMSFHEVVNSVCEKLARRKDDAKNIVENAHL